MKLLHWLDAHILPGLSAEGIGCLIGLAGLVGGCGVIGWIIAVIIRLIGRY